MIRGPDCAAFRVAPLCSTAELDSQQQMSGFHTYFQQFVSKVSNPVGFSSGFQRIDTSF